MAALVYLVRRVGETWRGHRLILFGFLPQSSKTEAVAAMPSVTHARSVGSGDTSARRADLGRFRQELYASFTARADALFELTDAVLCADGPVGSLVELTLLAEHRAGMGPCTTRSTRAGSSDQGQDLRGPTDARGQAW
jgi:hypothetical protein